MLDVLEALRDGLGPHYTVEREIGAGGMARVYLAHERHPPRKVAIKVMDPRLSTPAFRKRFIREVELTSRLSHPNIVPILAADECLFVPEGPEGLCYYVMPYIEGESLRARLARERTLPLDQALRIALQVAGALGYAHSRGIVHRDVKPENILLSGDSAFVADFGIARAVSAAGSETLTGVGQPVGSLGYMSPEQLSGSRALDARTDIYSLGAVLYEMLVGQPPILDLAEGSAPGRAALDAALRARRVPARAARMVLETLGRALAAFPGDRFATVDDFAACLGEAMNGRGRGWWAAARVPRVSRRAAILGGGAVLGLAAGLALFARPSGLDPRRVVVAGFEDLSGDAALGSLAHVAADWVTQALVGSGGLEVVPAAVGAHLDAAGLEALAGRTRAGTVVAGSYYRSGDSVLFHIQVIDARRGVVRRAGAPVGARADAPLEAAEAVRRRVAALFDTLFAGRAP
ncbi:MAG TPA: serine/threonine-protein kinase [Gemmatimonadales bacterium]|nr:serine/threonine-protein kinase [Gemmatimonadales bacterium]